MGEKKICLKYIKSVQRLLGGWEGHLIGTRTVTRSEKYSDFYNEDICESPVEGAFERNFVCEIEATKSIKHISKQ